MLRISFLELLIKGIPEGFLDVLGIFVFTRTKLDRNKYLISSLIMIAATYLIRLLPISYGVHTMLTLILLIILSSAFLHIDLSKAIVATLIMVTILIISEETNLIILQMIYGAERTQELLQDSVSKSINTIPSTVVFFALIMLGQYIMKRLKKKEKKAEDGEALKKDS